MKPNKSTRSSGLRRYIAQPDRYAERYGNFMLTPRDYEILDLIYLYRYLEARHIRTLIAGSNQQITRRLQGLFHNKYIGRYVPRQRIRMELDPGPPAIAYGLETRGARAVAAHVTSTRLRPIDPAAPPPWRKAHTRRTEWFLEHRLMISDVRCAIEIGVQSVAGLTLSRWIDGDCLKLRAVSPGTSSRSATIVPDAYFTVSEPARPYFLEVDRGTEEHHRLLRKFEYYWWYLDQRDPANAALKRARVLFVVCSETRKDNLIATLGSMRRPSRARHGGKGLFLFCTVGEINACPRHAMTAPIWDSTNRRRIGLLPWSSSESTPA